jgi:hypothetical protein
MAKDLIEMIDPPIGNAEYERGFAAVRRPARPLVRLLPRTTKWQVNVMRPSTPRQNGAA